MDTSRQKISKEIKGLKDIKDELYLTNLYKTLQSERAEYLLFLNTHGIFSKRDHLNHNENLNKFKNI